MRMPVTFINRAKLIIYGVVSNLVVSHRKKKYIMIEGHKIYVKDNPRHEPL